MALPGESLMSLILKTSDEAAAIDAQGVYGVTGPSAAEHLPGFKALGASAVPYLLSVLDGEREGYWAARALKVLGREASSASKALEDRVPAQPDLAGPLFCVDPDRALALGLHENEQTRGELLEAARDLEAEPFARLMQVMLQSKYEAVVRDALRDSRSGQSCHRLAREHPELLPLELLRELARGANARGACSVLAVLRVPADASLVLERGDDFEGLLEWLAPLPGSERLAKELQPWNLCELFRRRRGAGLSTDPALAKRAMRECLERAQYAGQTQLARLMRETGDDAALPQLPDFLGAYYVWESKEAEDPVLLLLGMKGAAGLGVLEAGIARTTGRQQEHLRNVRVQLERWKRPVWTTVEGGDARYLEGRLESGTGSQDKSLDEGAYGSYSLALLFDPRCAHAAIQLARIDRGFGTPITRERLDWLRSLGVHDEALLTELATAVPGLQGGRCLPCGSSQSAPALATRAEAAGLPSVAANCRHGEKEEIARLKAAAQQQLDVTRAASR
jgi:hypothetical protein